MGFDAPVPPLRPIETIPHEENGQPFVVLRDPQGISETMIAVAAGLMPLLALFDGNRSLRDVAEIVSRDSGESIEPAQLHPIVEMLENARLLHSESFLRHRLEVEEAWREQEVREPVLDGGGFPAEAGELAALIDTLLASEPPEDFAPETPLRGKRLRGIVAPHIDYQRGGRTYGRLYRQVTELLPPEDDGPLLAGIIGVAHAGAFEPLVTAEKDFRTPLGVMKYDRAAASILRERVGESAFREGFVHKGEHSVEIQLPWLQYLLADRDDVTFLPLLAGILDTGENGGTPGANPGVRGLIDALREVERAHDGPVLWFASVDFSHIGPAFGDPEPVTDEQLAAVERDDMRVLEAMQAVDPDAWWTRLATGGNPRRVCGMNALYLTMSLLSGCRGRILDYQQAVSEDRTTMVSHAAAIFQEA